ncbi:tetratricopeptide repeat protein, partial [candidate division KSB1 bacterium]
DKAFGLYEDLIEENPEWAELYLRLGNLYGVNNEIEKALDIFEQGVQRFPDYVIFQNRYGRYLVLTGDNEKGIEQSKKAYAQMDDNAASANRLGILYYYAGQLDSAVVYLEKAVEMTEGANSTHSHNLARAYCANAQFKEAADAFREAHKLLDFQRVEEIYAASFGIGEYRKTTIQKYLKGIVDANSNLGAWGLFYKAYIGDIDKAMEYLENNPNYISSNPLIITKDPMMDPLREDARFIKMLKDRGLDKYQNRK